MNWLKNIFSPKKPRLGNSNTEKLVSQFKIRESKMRQAGSVDGLHYTEHAEKVRQLKKEKRHTEAIDLLLKLIDATEAEAKVAGENWGVAPWYYEQLAIIYRKEKRFDDEVEILERYEAKQKAPGVGPGKLSIRLAKAREISFKRRE